MMGLKYIEQAGKIDAVYVDLSVILVPVRCCDVEHLRIERGYLVCNSMLDGQPVERMADWLGVCSFCLMLKNWSHQILQLSSSWILFSKTSHDVLHAK